MKKSLKTVLSVILTAAMLLTVMLPAFAATGKAADGKVRFNIEKVENGPEALRSENAASVDLQEALPKGDVRVSIVLEDKSTLESGFSTRGISANKRAMAYRAQLQSKQNSVAQAISKKVLGGKSLEVKWNLTLAANIISAVVPGSAIPQIEQIPGVAKVVIEQQYEPAAAKTEVAEPNMITAGVMTGSTAAWASGYTGLGSIVAIIDTGIDTDHQSFAADSFDYAVAESGKEVDLLTAAEVADIYENLNIAQDIVDGSAAYISSKIPFALNYVDSSTDVTHDNDTQGEHGSHVAGIAAANRFIKQEDGSYANALEAVSTQGAAPDAQILVMKVFGKKGGAYDSDYMAAIEDAVMLGADAINLSLGSAAAGFATDDTYQDILDNFQNYDAVVSISAGNAGAWADETENHMLFGPDVNYDTVGSPGSFTNAFTVASVDNDGSTGPYLTADGKIIYYTETYDKAYNNAAFVTLAGEQEFVYVDAVGREEEFAAIAELLAGKIGICNRGATSFYQKANAGVEAGAIGVIVANNQDGTISMNLKGYQYTAPCVSITKDDGEYLRSIATGTGSFECDYYDEDENATFHETVTYYTGSLTVSGEALTTEADEELEYHTMSSFTSYGVPGDLSLKPEITAPGGNIYSVNGLLEGGLYYENMSGTSMAAPHITGLSAVLMQYIRENDLEAKTGLTARQLTQSLLMSTAEPMADEYGYPYAVFQQGAGLADVSAALNAKSYVMMDDSFPYAADGKVKAELGDDPERTGEYDVAFTLNNFSDEDVEYMLESIFFTQWMYQGIIRDTSTDYLAADVTWTVNGVEYDHDAVLDYDFNLDGLVNKNDVQYLLDYLTGINDTLYNEEYADFDEDGDVDTYDAFLILKYLSGVTVTAPAGESLEINAHIVLGDEIADADWNGAYVEGYIYAVEMDSADGALGTIHSIPVLGFYGSWTEASMYDMDYFDALYGLSYFPYYVDYEQGFLVKFAGGNSLYFLGGNPAVSDEEYMPERNAISAKNGDAIAGAQSVLIRNAAASRFTITDAEGNDLIDPVIGGQKYGAYYYASQGSWQSTSAVVSAAYVPTDVAEGDVINMSVTYAPEYYVGEDGEVDWDALGEGATRTMSVVVDNTDPELIDAYVMGYDDETCAWDTLSVIAKDNQYIAAIAVFDEYGDIIDYTGSDPYAQPGDSMTFTLAAEDIGDCPSKVLIQVYDYASNITNYKLNLDLDDMENPVTVSVPATAAVVPGNSIKLAATVEPWGVDESVTWTSSDETIATVDANGVVTGIAEGECLITATSKIDPDASADCVLTVMMISKDLNAAVWDEEGQVWFSAFNTKTLPEYTKLTEESTGAAILSVTYDVYDEQLYAADTDYIFYKVDDETFELTPIGESNYYAIDLACAYATGDDIAYAVYGPYVFAVDLATGAFIDDEPVLDASNSIEAFAGIAFAGIMYHPTYSQYIDIYYLIDVYGDVYYTAFIDYYGTIYHFGLNYVDSLGYESTSAYYNSVYYDFATDSLYWSRFNSDVQDIICYYDIDNSGYIFKLGEFAENVWPASGLFELVPSDGDDGDYVVSPALAAQLEGIEPQPCTTKEVKLLDTDVKGKLTADDDTPGAPDAPADPMIKTVDLTAADAATNGLIYVEYDGDNYKLADVKSSAKLYSVYDDGYSVTFAYVTDEDDAYDKDAVIATLYFRAVDEDSAEEPLGEDISTIEVNNEHLHYYVDVYWDWIADADSAEAYAIFACLTHNDEDYQFADATVKKIDEAAATCTEAGYVVYEAAAEINGKTYTDTYTVETDPAKGHEWDEGVIKSEPTCTKGGAIKYTCIVCGAVKTAPLASGHIYKVAKWNWSEDLTSCTVDLVCARDDTHTATANAEVTVTEIDPTFTGNGSLIYTATYGDETDEVVVATDTKLHKAMNAANGWAADTGMDAFISGSDTNGKDNTAEIAINVDGIWGDLSFDGAFDGFMTAVGKAITEYFGDADVTIDGNAVFADGKLQNTAVKNALFDIGAGFFYKIANLGDDGVYGVYNVKVNDEDVVLTVKIVGSDANIAKVKEFAGVIAEHISAEVVDGNLVIDLIAPDQLVSAIAGMYHGEETVAEALKGIEIGNGLNMLPKDASAVFGSQVTAVNKLCAFLCKLSPLVNKVLEKVTEATVTLADGTDVALLDGAFNPAGASYADLLAAVIAALDDALLTKTVGDFAEEDGVYTIPVNVTVDMTNLGLMAGSTIQETVIFKLHLFDNCTHPETIAIDAVEPTCTETGLTAGTYCRICGDIVTGHETVDALGHDFDDSIATNVTIVPATCTAEGSKTVKCSRCDVTETTAIAKTAHTLEKVEAKEATYTADGNIEYYKCSVCGKLFADAEGKTELQPEDVVIPKLTDIHRGDVDDDGDIDTADARFALRIAVDLDPCEEGSDKFLRADVDSNGKVNTVDARNILRVAVGLDKPDWAAWFLNQ